MQRYKEIVNKQTVRAINTSFSIYSINGPYYVGYSLSASAAQVSPTFSFDIIGNVIAGAEYLSLQKDFNFVKVRAVAIHISPCIGNATDIASLPNIYLDLYAGTQGTYTVASAFLSDTAVVFEPRTTTRGVVTKYSMPGSIIGTNGYPVGGKDTWIATGSYANTGVLNVIVGWNTSLPPQYISGAANSAYRIATVDVVLDCMFGGAVFAS